jgi:hypothetical protein
MASEGRVRDSSIRTNSRVPLMRETVELLDGEF